MSRHRTRRRGRNELGSGLKASSNSLDSHSGVDNDHDASCLDMLDESVGLPPLHGERARFAMSDAIHRSAEAVRFPVRRFAREYVRGMLHDRVLRGAGAFRERGGALRVLTNV